MRKQPSCPECEKLAAVSEEANKIGDFLNWLGSKEVVLGGWYGDEFLLHEYRLSDSGINKMLADYYSIDLDKVDRERKALLEWIRERQ